MRQRVAAVIRARVVIRGRKALQEFEDQPGTMCHGRGEGEGREPDLVVLYQASG